MKQALEKYRRELDAIREAGETPYVVVSIENGEKGVVLC